MSNSLDSLVHVQHNVNGEPSFEPYHLDCTNLEFIKHLLVSSENFNKNITSLLENIRRKDGRNDSKICYVGTHALNVKKDKIQEIDDQLSHIASELNLHSRSFWSSPEQQLETLFPIDLFPDDKERAQSFENIIDCIRDNILKQVHRRDYYEVPITWFIFLLSIQKFCHVNKVSYISYQKAVDVWMDENVSQNEPGGNSEAYRKDVNRDNSDVHSILVFFHFMGILFYYHKVKGMRDFIFVDRQWLFEKLTQLVEIKFKKGCSILDKTDISAEDVKKFTMEGRLNINIIENLKINLQGIQPIYFIHLLDHLNIVAPIDLEPTDYFMPCVLPTYPLLKSSQKFDLDKFYGTIQHVPLLVGFMNGPMPHGFFSHLIVNLFRNLPTGWIRPLLSSSGMQHVYNNLMTFPTNSGHAISLFYKIGYVEIQVRHREAHPTIIHFDVHHKLDKALSKVSSHLQLNKEQLCYGLYCNCKEKHFTNLENFTLSTKYICCGYNYFEMTEDHRVWLQVKSYKHNLDTI